MLDWKINFPVALIGYEIRTNIVLSSFTGSGIERRNKWENGF